MLNTQQYKVRIKGKSGAIQGKELRPPLHLGVVAIEKEPFGCSRLRSPNLLTYSCWKSGDYFRYTFPSTASISLGSKQRLFYRDLISLKILEFYSALIGESVEYADYTSAKR